MNNGIASVSFDTDGETLIMKMKQLNEHRCNHMPKETKVAEYQGAGWIIAERGNVLIGIKCCPYCGLVLDEELREESINIGKKEEEIDWSKVEIDTEILVPFYGIRHFSHYDNEENKIYFFPDGTTSAEKGEITICAFETEDVKLTE